MKVIRLVMVAVVWAGCFGVAQGAEPAGPKVAFDIAQQPLREALREFAAQTGLQVMLREEDVQGGQETAENVRGEMAPREALQRLLEKTNLKYEFVTEKMIRISSENFSQGTQGVGAEGARVAQIEGAPSSPAVGEGARSADGDRKGGTGRTAESEEGKDTISEIIVTAQKRIERLQDVPISMSVVDGKLLDAAAGRGITDALQRVPGVAINESGQGGGTMVTIRGVTSGFALVNGTSMIAYYIDSIPFALVRSAILPDPAAYDLDRVEVLRGPQGTLYGSSGAGGVVRVLTKDANLHDFEFKMRSSVSNTKEGSENYRGDAAVNIPIVDDKLAVRLVAGYNDVGGYIDSPVKKDVDSARIGNVRIKVGAQLTDRTRVNLFSSVQRNRYDKLPTSSGPYDTTNSLDQPSSLDLDANGLTIAHEFAGFEVNSATSYLDYANKNIADLTENFPTLPGRRLMTNYFSKIFTEEVLFNSSIEGPWAWSLGFFYRDAKDTFVQELVQANAGFIGNLSSNNKDRSKSHAIFGEGSRSFLDDKFKLTVGLRYFRDDGSTRDDVFRVPSTTVTSKAWTPRIVLAWTPSEKLTAYSSYSQGFRSGFSQYGAVLATYPNFPPAKPDKLHNYEVGAKGVLLGSLLYYETSLYYLKWKGIQQSLAVTLPNAIAGIGIANGTSASGVGADAELSVRPTRRLEIGGSISWNNLHQDSNVLASGAVLIPKGSRLQLSPEYTVGAFAGYSFPIFGDLEGTLSGSFNYRSPQVPPLSGNRDPIALSAYKAANARFAVNSNHWTVTAYVENIANDRGITSKTTNPDFRARLRPRTTGLQAEYNF